MLGLVDLHAVTHRRVARWRQDGRPPWDQRYVSVGWLPDGRWYVDLVAQLYHPARTFGSEAEARKVADRLMAVQGEGWRPVPPYPTEAAVERMRGQSEV